MGAAELLGPSGPFAGGWPGHETRPGQLEMARAVERCLEREGIAIIQAGTGTGKTLAYLVPALLAARDKRIIISTATRALQDQIYGKDLPLLERVLGTGLPVALMKGLPNYVCQRRHHELSTSAESLDERWQRTLPLVDSWLATSPRGAIEELDGVAEDDPIWARITASSERRVGPTCQFFESCHVTRMKREAAAARIVVVNHHLFFADLALRGAHPASVLPDYDAVIFDEAHQLEDVATAHFGLSVSSARVARLCSDARALFERQLGAGAPDPMSAVQRACDGLFEALERAARSGEGRVALPPETWAGAVEGRWFELDSALEGLEVRLSLLGAGELGVAAAEDGPGEALGALERRARALRDDLAAIARGAPGCVTWFEASGRSRKLSASPVELADLFRSRLFDVVPAVVLTSATLATGSARSSEASPSEGEPRSEPRPIARAVAARAALADEQAWPVAAEGLDRDPAEPELEGWREALAPRLASGPFRFMRQRLGLDPDLYQVDELRVDSPFRFEQQALLYLPRDLPLPDEPAFVAAAAERSAALIEGCDGGAFVLTTSVRSMQALHAALAERGLGRTLLVQGQAPKAALIERFRVDGRAVLVATSSFWQGVDVPGAALRLVVLEKTPFPVPSDPIIQARSLALQLRGESPFTRLHLPLAQLTLEQGFGRLIRSESDYGVVALLDARVHRRGYGRRLLVALPPARRASELAEVAAFWAEHREPAP